MLSRNHCNRDLAKMGATVTVLTIHAGIIKSWVYLTIWCRYIVFIIIINFYCVSYLNRIINKCFFLFFCLVFRFIIFSYLPRKIILGLINKCVLCFWFILYFRIYKTEVAHMAWSVQIKPIAIASA